MLDNFSLAFYIASNFFQTRPYEFQNSLTSQISYKINYIHSLVLCVFSIHICVPRFIELLINFES